jgi:hypothetical protein
VFWWDELSQEAALTRSRKPVFRRWSVYNTSEITVETRVFLIAQGGISDGIIASGHVAEPPHGKASLREDTAVYLDSSWKTGEPSNYIMVEFDAILDVRNYPVHALTIERLNTGSLRMMHWNIERPGVKIKPKRTFPQDVNLLPDLETAWQIHLKHVAFPVIPSGEDERAVIDLFGYEGTIKLRIHKNRERQRHLVDAKKAEAIKKYSKLQCEACGFEFTSRYGDHGRGFIECHHRLPLSMVSDDGCRVTLADLALVCANCHRMLHWKDWPSIDELRSRISKSLPS